MRKAYMLWRQWISCAGFRDFLYMMAIKRCGISNVGLCGSIFFV